MITVKSQEDLKWMRHSGHITATILNELKKSSVEGIFAKDLDRIAETMIKNMGAVSAFKGYRGYPKTITVSINEQVVHGIPGTRPLQKGDLVSIDMGVFYKGHCSDSAISLIVGEDDSGNKLLEVTKESLYRGISKATANNRLGDISYAVQSYVGENGFSVVRDLVGHGIGRQMHEDPQIPNFGKAGTGPRLRNGFTLAIEPMVNAGDWKVECLKDGWTVVTADGTLSAHFEHTVAITEKGPRILTLPFDAPESQEYPFLQGIA